MEIPLSDQLCVGSMRMDALKVPNAKEDALFRILSLYPSVNHLKLAKSRQGSAEHMLKRIESLGSRPLQKCCQAEVRSLVYTMLKQGKLFLQFSSC